MAVSFARFVGNLGLVSEVDVWWANLAFDRLMILDKSAEVLENPRCNF